MSYVDKAVSTNTDAMMLVIINDEHLYHHLGNYTGTQADFVAEAVALVKEWHNQNLLDFDIDIAEVDFGYLRENIL
jgi:hypothetical protein